MTPRPYSLRRHLMWVVLSCAVPLALMLAWFVRDNIRLQRQLVEESVTLTAQRALSSVELALTAIESGLRVLASSSDLVNGDLAAFQRQARDAVPGSVVRNCVLTDREGRQRVNTLVPYGMPLPTRGTPAQLGTVFQDGRTVLTDLFTGPVTGVPTIAMGVPVLVNGRIEYSLNIGMVPEVITRNVQDLHLPEGWLVAVLDSKGVIVGRSRDAEKFVGEPAVDELWAAIQRSPSGQMRSVTKDGIPVVTSFRKSDRWGWTVVVGAPEQVLYEHQAAQVQLALIGAAIGLVLTIALAFRLSFRALRSIRAINRQALTLVEGGELRDVHVDLEEASAIGAALARASVVLNDARFLAEHDSLTQLRNRAYLDAHGPQALALAERAGWSLAVVMLDLDGFKAVNDLYGHAMGDAVLKEAALRIRQIVRTEDVVARLGGDEFCLILQNADRERAQRTVERLLESLSAPYSGVQPKVSASAGVALFPAHADTWPELLRQADAAMYAVKQSGKDAMRFVDLSQ